MEKNAKEEKECNEKRIMLHGVMPKLHPRTTSRVMPTNEKPEPASVKRDVEIRE